MTAFRVHEPRLPSEWTEGVARFGQHWGQDDGRTVTLRGSCPNCTHEMSVELSIEERSGTRITHKRDNELLGSNQFLKVASCNCLDEHAGRPEGSSGCGAFGALMIGGSPPGQQ